MGIKYNKKYQEHPVYRRLMSPGPKRILALDGGGIRGALTIGFLERIESILRERYGESDYRLSQYYDLIGGTSTGAIIATLLARGLAVEKIKNLYFEFGNAIFSKLNAPLVPKIFRYFLRAEYDEKPLEAALKSNEYVGELNLGSTEFKTGFCVVCRRADNYRTYAFTNHPASPFYEQNNGIRIPDLLRATSAAPSYFRSKVLTFDNDDKGVFIDGGVSSANNPSLLLFMLATMKEFGFNWGMGRSEMMITSLGTGYYRPKAHMAEMKKLAKRRTILWAGELPNLFMADATDMNHTLLDHLSRPLHLRHQHHTEDGLETYLNIKSGAFSYKRFDIKLSQTRLNKYDISYDENRLISLRKMDAGGNARDLYAIGHKIATADIHEKHFPANFDATSEKLQSAIMDHNAFVAKVGALINQKGNWYKKVASIIATRATGGEKIMTVADDFTETENTAEKGDYIVQNQTSEKEEYIVRNRNFDQRYEVRRTLPDGRLECNPIGRIKAVQLSSKNLNELDLPNHFMFKAPWGEAQYARIGDYLACNGDYDDIYRISQKLFYETYDAE